MISQVPVLLAKEHPRDSRITENISIYRAIHALIIYHHTVFLLVYCQQLRLPAAGVSLCRKLKKKNHIPKQSKPDENSPKKRHYEEIKCKVYQFL